MKMKIFIMAVMMMMMMKMIVIIMIIGAIRKYVMLLGEGLLRLRKIVTAFERKELPGAS